jgi:hypothetical protein
MSIDVQQRAQDVAFRAERLEAAGQCDEAKKLYLEAAALEDEVLREIPASRPKTRGIIAVSTASLYWRAGVQDEVVRVAREYLAVPDLPEFARIQLGDLLVNRDPWLRRAIPDDDAEADDLETAEEARTV